MDIARLSIVLDARTAQQQIAQLKADLTSIAAVTKVSVSNAGQSFKTMEGQLNQIRISVNTLNQTMGTAMSRSAQSVRAATVPISDMGAALSRLGGFFAAAFSIRELSRFATEAVKTNIEFKRMDNVLTGLSGSSEKAKEQLGYLSGEADRLGLNFRSSVQAFVRFSAAAKGSTIGDGSLREIFSSTAEAARKFGLTTSEQERIFLAYEQMISKGVVSMEELRRQLGDALPGAFSIGARAMGMTTKQFGDFVQTGKLMSQDFLPKFAKQLSHDVTGAIDDLAVSLGKTQNAWDRFKNSIGEAARPAVKSASDAIGSALSEADISLRYGQFMTKVPTEGDQQIQTLLQLRKEFPNAPRTRFQRDPNFDSYRLYKQMMSENQQAIGAAPVTGSAYQSPDFGLNLPELPPAEPMDQSLTTKFERELNKLTLDRLEGRDKIIESYKQEKEAIIAMGLPLDKESQLVALIAQNQTKALDEDLFKSSEEQTKRLTEEMTNLNEASEKLFTSTLSKGQSEVEKINQSFRDNVNLLIQLDEFGANNKNITYDQLVEARDRSLSDLLDTKERGNRRNKAQSFSDVAAGWGDLENRIREGSGTLASQMEQNFTDAFSSMIMGTQSVGDAFRNMATSIVSDLVRVMVQQLIVRSVLQGIGIASGTIGIGNASTDSAAQLKAGMTSDIRGAYHNGGVVGFSSGPVRRFHNGGVAGDEQMVINRRGEVYFTPEQMSVLGKTMAGAGGRQQKVEVVNVMDPALFPESLYKNKNAIINIIGKESKTVRRTLS